MIHRKVLEHLGCTTNRLREISTATSGPNFEILKCLKDRIASRIIDGVQSCAKSATIWQAVDLAWDSTPIHKETIPLLLWAQGKIKDKSLIDQLSKLECAAQFTQRVPIRNAEGKVTGEEIKVDAPRLYEMSINLVRSYITRRLAAQTARFSNLWPYFSYEPRGQDLVSKLRADALSERVDVMANHYNYRHFFPQTFRHQFMYSRSVIFPRCAWDRVSGWRAKDITQPVGDLNLESYLQREGIDFVAPHPSRVFWDRSSPLANINTDTGPSYLGYWDIIPYRSICDGEYWNVSSITAGSELNDLLTKHSGFFSQYFDQSVLQWPEIKSDPAATNDRLRNSSNYSSVEKDKGCLITQYYEKVNPHHLKIAKLNQDVWIRWSVAGDDTIVGGEFLTSLPACYGGLNENDDREINASMATELMGYQDQLTNIFSQMLMNIKAGALQIWAIDQDALDEDMKEHVKATLKAKDYYSEPKAFFYSGEKLRSLGVTNPADNPRAFLTIIQANIQTTIEQSMKAAMSVLSMCDKLQMFSPNEGAQPNPREVAAREITEISSSTDSIKTFVSDGIDEQRAAVKRLIYESLVNESHEEVKVPVMDRYTRKTIEEAGFKAKGEWKENEIIPLKTPITGAVHHLVYDYYYDSRDGGDRPVNSQGAAVMSQLLGQFMQVEPIAKAFGKKRLFEWANEIARMSGAPADLKLELDDNEQDAIGGGDEALLGRIAKIEEFLGKIEAAMGGAQPAGPAPDPAAPMPMPTDGAELPAALMTG
jgi:hypothetical protein